MEENNEKKIKKRVLKTQNTNNTSIGHGRVLPQACLLYTSDAADDLLCVDLGGRRIIKKKNI